MRVFHSGNVQCELCPKILIPANLSKHMENCHKPGETKKPTRIKKTEKTKEPSESDKAAEKGETENANTSFPCIPCGKEFNGRKTLRCHDER